MKALKIIHIGLKIRHVYIIRYYIMSNDNVNYPFPKHPGYGEWGNGYTDKNREKAREMKDKIDTEHRFEMNRVNKIRRKARRDMWTPDEEEAFKIKELARFNKNKQSTSHQKYVDERKAAKSTCITCKKEYSVTSLSSHIRSKKHTDNLNGGTTSMFNEGEYWTIVWQKDNETLRKTFSHTSKSKVEVDIKNFAEMRGIVLPDF
jgi:thiaminase